MTPRQKQARFRARIKNAAWLIVAAIIVSMPELMILHWIVFGY